MLLHARMPINSMAGKSFLEWAFAEDDFFAHQQKYPICHGVSFPEKKQNKKNSWDNEDGEFSSLLLFGGIWLYGSGFRWCSCGVWNVALYLMRSNKLQYLAIWLQKYQYYAMNRYFLNTYSYPSICVGFWQIICFKIAMYRQYFQILLGYI